MRKIALVSLLVIGMTSCSKKDSDNNTAVTPTTTSSSVEKTNGSIVKLVSTSHKSSDRYLDVNINYLSGNTGSYNYDVLLVYCNGNQVISRNTTIKGINQSETITTDKFTTTGDYHLLFLRSTGGVYDTLVDLTGN